MNENNRLYIIGNGFDRHHNFPTSYYDFDNFMESWSPEMYHEIHEYWNFDIKSDRWCDFENDLKSYKSSIIYNICAERHTTAEEIADECAVMTQKIFKGITNCFIDWVKKIKLEPQTKILSMKLKAQYITFNYTRTLQDIYKIPEEYIWHIHGSSLDSEVIFGHKVKRETNYKYSDDIGMPLTEEEWSVETYHFSELPFHQFRKKTDKVISKNKMQFLKYQNLERIYVLGHSLADVDLPYFEEIHKNNKEAKWYVSYYLETDQEYLCSQLKKVGVEEFQIKTITINDI